MSKASRKAYLSENTSGVSSRVQTREVSEVLPILFYFYFTNICFVILMAGSNEESEMTPQQQRDLKLEATMTAIFQ